jgi:hypothetical protein
MAHPENRWAVLISQPATGKLVAIEKDLMQSGAILSDSPHPFRGFSEGKCR